MPDETVGDIDVALPRRESKRGRGHKGFEVHGDPSMSIEEAARRRDFTINAISWDPLTGEYRGSLRRPRRPRRVACCAPSIRRPSATTACACCARFSSPRDSSSRSTTRHRGAVPRDSARRPAGGADLGRDREAAAQGRTAVNRLRARARPRRHRSGAARDAAAGRLRAGAGMASRRRRLDRTR